MKLKLLPILKFALRILAETVLQNIYLRLIALLLPLSSTLLLAGILSSYLKQIMQKDITTLQLTITPVLLVQLILALSFTIIVLVVYFKIKKDNPKNYILIDDGGFKWKVIKYPFNVIKAPFCPIHQLQMDKIKNCFVCPECGQELKTDTKYDIIELHTNIVKHKAEAIMSGHYKK